MNAIAAPGGQTARGRLSGPGADRTGIAVGGAGAALAWSAVAAVEGWPALPTGTVEAVLALALFQGVGASVLGRERLHHLLAVLGLFAAYASVALASALVADDPVTSLEAWQKLVRAQLFGVAAYLLASRFGRLTWLTWGAVVGTGLVAAAAVFSAPGPFRGLDAHDINDRLVGPLGDGNFFGQHLLVGFALAVGLLRRQRLVVPWLTASGVALVSLVAIVATESRGAALGLFAITIVHLRVLPPRGRVIAVALAVVAGALLLPSSTLGERLGRAPASVDSALQHGVAEDTAVSGRLSENIAGLRMTLDHPLLGVGIGNYPRQYLDYSREIGMDARLEQRNAHNLHLEVAAETGLIGAATWGAIILAAGLHLLRAARDPDASLDVRRLAGAWGLAFLSFLVTSVFLHANHPEVQWLLVGTAFAVGEVHRRAATGPAAGGPDRTGSAALA